MSLSDLTTETQLLQPFQKASEFVIVNYGFKRVVVT